MKQELNEDICKIYQQKRQYLRELNIFNDAIVQRELSGQLQQKCDIPEIWALLIIIRLQRQGMNNHLIAGLQGF